MNKPWVVLLNTGTDIYAYGPMDRDTAEKFGEFMTSAVDPVSVRPLHSPTREILGWWKNEQVRNNCTHGANCEVHPDARGVHLLDNESTHDQQKGVNR